MLEAIGAGVKRRVGNRDWAELWVESPEFAQVKDDIAAIKKESLSHTEEVDADAEREFATSFATQLKVVGRRTMTAFYRNPDYGLTRLFCHAAVALLTSLTFLNVQNSAAALQYRVFSIFMATVLPALIITTVEPVFIMARMTFIRERSSKMYSEIVFAMGQLAAEMPYSLLCAVVFFLLF
jgi:ATP-binding cassette subfamily G (WHITE) protein 2 (SNQ2)